MKTAVVTTLLILLASPAWTAEPKIKELEPLAGSWHCTGETVASSLHEVRPLEYNLQLHYNAGKMRYRIHLNNQASGRVSNGFLHFDDADGLFKADLDHGQQTASSMTSSGWQGERIVFDVLYTEAGMPKRWRYDWTLTDADHIAFLWQFQDAAGWAKAGDLTCARQGK